MSEMIACKCWAEWPKTHQGMLSFGTPVIEINGSLSISNCPSCATSYWTKVIKKYGWDIATGKQLPFHHIKCVTTDCPTNLGKCFCQAPSCEQAGSLKCSSCLLKENYALCDPDDPTPCHCNRCYAH